MEEKLQDPYEYEVDLRDYITVIWNQKWLIIAVFVLAVVLAGWYSMRQPSTYETQATLLVTPRVSEQIVKGEEGGLSSVSLPSLAYERSALASDLLDQIIKDLDLTNSKGELISVASLKNRLKIDVETKTRQETNGKTLKVPLVTMTVRGGEPEEIKKIGNKWANLFQKRTTELFSSETARSFQFISSRFQEVQKKLRSLEEEKQNYREDHPLNILKSEVSVLKSKYSSFLSQLENIKAELKSKRARLNELEEEFNSYQLLNSLKKDELKSQYKSLLSELEDKRRQLNYKKSQISHIRETLKKENKFIEPQRSVSKEAIWDFLDEGLTQDQLKKLPGLKVTDQIKNNLYFSLKSYLTETKITISTLQEDIPNLEQRISDLKGVLSGNPDELKISGEQRQEYYFGIRKEIGDLRPEVKALEEEASYYVTKTKEFKEQIEDKQARIDRTELKLEQLDRSISRLKDSYKSLSANLEEARIAKEEKESSIRIMEQAVAPEKPLSTNTKQNVAVAGVLGLFIGVLIAFFRNYMQGYEEEEETEEKEDDQEEEEI